MEIVDAFVDYRAQAGTLRWRSGTLHVLIERAVPPLDEFVFEQRGPLLVGEHDGLVRAYLGGYEWPGYGPGFTAITMRGGAQRYRRLLDRARPGLVNIHFPERPVVGVVVGEHEDRADKPDWTFGLALTLERTREALDRHLVGWALRRTERFFEPEWTLVPPSADALEAAWSADRRQRNPNERTPDEEGSA